MNRILTALVLALMLTACAETASDSSEGDGAMERSAISTEGLPPESERLATERRLQLERSVDQWFLAYQQQEFSKADGLATHLEQYVNNHLAAIERDVQTSSPRFRKVAAAALGFSGKEEVVPVLIGALKDPFQDVVLASLLSLWRLSLSGVKVPAQPVAPLLGHSVADIRSNAAMVLAHAVTPADKDLFLPLTSAMEDEDAGVRLHAAVALGALGEPDAVPFLVKALDDPKALVRIRSAYALGRIGSRAAVPALIDHLDDPNNDVSKAIHKALQTITGQKIPRLKHEWKNYWKENA